MGHAVNTDSLDARDWLELQVSLLADGTIDPLDQPMVEAAVMSDPSLQVLLSNLRDTNALLRRTPDFDRMNFAGLTDSVMQTVRVELAAGGDLSDPLSLPVPSVPGPLERAAAAARPATAARWTLGHTIRWSGAAAALVVGLGVGAVVLQSGRPVTPAAPVVPSADPSLLVELGNQTVNVDPTRSDGGDGQIAVSGPTGEPAGRLGVESAIAPLPQSGGAVADATLNVTGPGVAASKAPKVHSSGPDYADAGVIDPARRAAVTSGNGTAVADAKQAD